MNDQQFAKLKKLHTAEAKKNIAVILFFIFAYCFIHINFENFK
jgi:hypothetical protein